MSSARCTRTQSTHYTRPRQRTSGLFQQTKLFVTQSSHWSPMWCGMYCVIVGAESKLGWWEEISLAAILHCSCSFIVNFDPPHKLSRVTTTFDDIVMVLSFLLFFSFYLICNWCLLCFLVQYFHLIHRTPKWFDSTLFCVILLSGRSASGDDKLAAALLWAWWGCSSNGEKMDTILVKLAYGKVTCVTPRLPLHLFFG